MRFSNDPAPQVLLFRLHFAIWRPSDRKYPNFFMTKSWGLDPISCPSLLSCPPKAGPKIIQFRDSVLPLPPMILLRTVHLTDEDTDVISDHCKTSSMVPEPMVIHTSTASPPLPSPLLCLRRTLACPYTRFKFFSRQMLLESSLGKAIRNRTLRTRIGTCS
jgi:hypothetical protein